MNMFQEKIQRIKNVQKKTLQPDFSYNIFSFLVFGIFLAAGIFLQHLLDSTVPTEQIVGIALGAIVVGGILTVFPLWIIIVQLIIASWLAMYFFFTFNFYPIFLLVSLGLIVSACFELIYQWDKVVILRFGKFKKVHGPGLFLLIPFVDRIASFVDTRIRATDFSAEKTLTSDTVPVHVDGLAFWMIWDAKRAILEVENFVEAVTLSAQTALRESIGNHDLNTLLTERRTLYKEIQEILDAKTNSWGITILSVEFTDIIIPQGLEDAMSKRAQAEREKQSRVILGTAEVEIAKKFAEASESYKDNETALHLRAMNMIYEGIRQKGSMILLPASALDSMNLGTVMGTAALKSIEAEGRGVGSTSQTNVPADTSGEKTEQEGETQ
jgi:regulator of protease activity HflC (stomatin/prohibitin superfamily)